MGASTQRVGDDDIYGKVVDDEEYVEGSTGEEDFVEEAQDDDPLEDSGNEKSFQGFRHEKPVNDERCSEKSVDEEIRGLLAALNPSGHSLEHSGPEFFPTGSRAWDHFPYLRSIAVIARTLCVNLCRLVYRVPEPISMTHVEKHS